MTTDQSTIRERPSTLEPWFRQFAGPSRSVVIALGGLSLATSVMTRFWTAPVVVVVLILVGRFIPVLRSRANPTFIAAIAVLCWIPYVSRGTLSFGSTRLGLGEVLAFSRVSLAIGILGLGITMMAARRLARFNRLDQFTWTLIAIWVVGAGTAAILVDPETWIDVWYLHRDAGRALLDGVSPYSGRSVPNPMDWFPEGSVFEGYVYPPMTLFTYGAADAFIGDSRWVGVAAGAMITFALWKTAKTPSAQAMAVLLLITPGWPVMVQLSWIEPASVALLVLAFTMTGRYVRPVLFGLFVASKQYLLMWALPATISWFGRKRTSLMIAGATAFAAYGVGLLYGPSDYVEWVFVFHLTAPTADIGSSLPGLARMLFDYPLNIPGWIGISMGAILGAAIAWQRPRSDGRLLLAGGMMMYVVFLLGSQAFPNYWYLIFTVVTFASITMVGESPTDEEVVGIDSDQDRCIPADHPRP